MHKVIITGIGFVSCIGTGKEEVASSLRNLRHGFKRIRLAGEEIGPELVCGSIDGFEFSSCEARDWIFPGSTGIDHGTLRSMPPHGIYALVALEEALQQAGLDRSSLGDGRTGLFCASAGSARLLHDHLSRISASNWTRASPMCVVRSIAGTLNFNLAAHYGITGASCGFVSACASSSHALGYAFDEIALGRQERMLVAAAEDGDAECLLPFLGMRALSSNPDPDTASRPFDQGRDGFVGSPGGAAIVLESAESASKRGAVPLARMLGWGQATDGQNVAAPHPEGAGIRAAMERCLASCGIDALDIGWINAHATSTPAGDRAEALAIKALGYARPEADTLISSTKGLTGHGLSFAGALEAAISVLCLQQGIIPGNAALDQPDPACEGLRLPAGTVDRNPLLILNNSSGFGGSNVTHLLGLC